MDERILLSHGAGGREMLALIEEVFRQGYAPPTVSRDDSAILTWTSGELAFTTDAFVVSPPFFPGGDIGRLAVAGTVNDLLTAAARPQVLAVSFILEEGLLVSELLAIVQSMRDTAAEAGVSIVTGDTKVVPRGAADRIFIATTAWSGNTLRRIGKRPATGGSTHPHRLRRGPRYSGYVGPGKITGR